MAKYLPDLDSAFAALADPTRRAIVSRLCEGPQSVSELSEPFDMALPSLLKHVRVLEQSGLVSSEKTGRVRTCRLGVRGLQEEAAWIERYRQLWSARFDELDNVVEELKQKEKADGRT